MKRLFYGAAALLLSAAVSAATLSPVQLLNPSGSTSGQAIVSTGPSTAPAWGNVTAAGLVAQAANTVLANVTASSASPTAFVMPSCSTSTSTLQYTSGTGFACNTSINAATLGGTTFAAPGPIGSTTAAAGKFTTLQATSAITPSSTAGIVGTTTNDSANAGSVGEVISSSTTTPGVSLTSGTGANVTSISLTAGDWDVWGNVYPVPAGSTIIGIERGTITTTTGAIGTYGDAGSFFSPLTMPTGNASSIKVGTVRLSLASTTTVFLVANLTFSTSTCSAFGQIFARRRR